MTVGARIVAIIIGAIAFLPPQANAALVYWSEQHAQTIYRASADGSDVQEVLTGIGTVRSLAIDSVNDHLYWTQSGGTDSPSFGVHAIRRSNLDGSQITNIVTSAYSGGSFLALDTLAERIYWTDSLDDNIRVANFDGSGVQVVISGTSHPNGIAIDEVGRAVYWTESTPVDRIRRAKLDGSNQETLVSTGLEQPGGIALDTDSGQMYFSDQQGYTIERADVDGSSREVVLSEIDITFPNQLALDLDAGFLYWTESAFTTGLLRRSHLDGSGIQNIAVGANPLGVALLHSVAEPVCDFTGDDICDVTDLDLMQSLGPIATGIPATGNEEFDLNGDEVIDLIDRDEWLAIAAAENGFGSPYILGDANLDGVVDGSDFIAWSTAKFTADLLWSKGNFNADSIVDGQDLLLWNTNKFTSSDGISAVPEPEMEMLLVVAMVLLGAATKRR